jgi:glycosyltransferase involved in cell wall biosynthesis
MRPLKILTWHTHGSYLYYLTQAPHQFYVLSKPDRPAGYGGRCGHIPWGDNVIDMPVSEVARHEFDCIIYQDDDQYLKDQYEYLTPAQRSLPRIYLEHDTPRDHPTDMRHPVDDPNLLLVHVTPFNELMWDNGRTPTRVIEHGVIVPRDIRYNGSIDRGVVIVNNLARRGRRLGIDVFKSAREKVPLDLVGMGAQELGGIGEIQYAQLPAFVANYRFLFNPIRYTSMGLAVIEAMMIGVPVIGLATTEMATAIESGKSGYVDTSVSKLISRMQELIDDPAEARRLGENARKRALERFGIERFVDDWNTVLNEVTAGGGANRSIVNMKKQFGASLQAG